jgi:glutamate/tyrosine decarboxylase-like PLP-dependent enzyme
LVSIADPIDEKPIERWPASMAHPIEDLASGKDILDAVRKFAEHYLSDLGDSRVRPLAAEQVVERLHVPLPERGVGGLEALEDLLGVGGDGAIRSSGPRFFHFVVGGTTPAALGADWFTSSVDQNAGMWAASPLAAALELVALEWLRELFHLPGNWGGVLTTGATMANFIGLACARRWWGLNKGLDIDEDGLTVLPPVISSGFLHASSTKALGMLGIGRKQVRLLAERGAGSAGPQNRRGAGGLDVDALHRELEAMNGRSAIVIANAGEVNGGRFDPFPEVIDVAKAHNSWVHVDGAFGLFSRVSDRTRAYTEGIERADSVIADGHKWLNVPHDTGFAFIAEPSLLAGVFGESAAYYVGGDTGQKPNWAMLGPESSRRARAFPVWATLRAYGRDGYRAMVERHLDLARRLAERVDAADDLERLTETPLNIVCFRYRPPGVSEAELDELNRRLGAALLEDGRVYAGTTIYEGRVALRPAIVNYRTTEQDVDFLVHCVREVGSALVG